MPEARQAPSMAFSIERPSLMTAELEVWPRGVTSRRRAAPSITLLAVAIGDQLGDLGAELREAEALVELDAAGAGEGLEAVLVHDRDVGDDRRDRPEVRVEGAGQHVDRLRQLQEVQRRAADDIGFGRR